MNASVLIITHDDNLINMAVDMLSTQLHRTVSISKTIRSGIRTLRNEAAPALLIVDLTLEDASCQPIELIEKLRNKVEFSELPVLAITDFPDPDQIKTVLQAGANRYLTKVFMGKNLLTTAQDLLQG